MERIIEKLRGLPKQSHSNKYDYHVDQQHVWSNWSWEEKKELLELYLLISQKESHIFDLIYGFHGCDSWEDMFRDYNTFELNEKAEGVKVAIKGLKERKQYMETGSFPSDSSTDESSSDSN
jgi:hypothetical protein